MNKKVFIGFLFILVILAALFFSQKHQENTLLQSLSKESNQTTLSLLPNPATISSTEVNKITIFLDTAENPVSFVQVKLTYDPIFLTNMHIEKGPFLTSATVLFDQVNTTNGTITYMLILPKGEKEVKGKGVIATLSFTNTMKPKDITPIKFSPDTIVTNNENPSSLLKKAIDTSIIRENSK